MIIEPIYLDHAATTPLRPEVGAAMEPHLAEEFGNPSSAHRWGRRAAAALERARETVADSLGARSPEVVFVRGGTESDNLAVLGRCRAERGRGRSPFAVASAVEHPAVRDALEVVAREGGRAAVISTGPDGALDLDALDRALAERPAVVSVMWVNNETGTVLPVEEVGARAREAGVPFHTDAVQAVGKLPVRVDATPVDLLTLTGHKIHGPKGTGVLWVRQGVEVVPLLHGGGQEGGLRAGTQDVAGAVGLAEALRLAVDEQASEARRLAGLRDLLERELLARVPDLRVHGAEGPRAPHVLNVGVPGVEQDALLAALDMEGLAVSAGSACSSGSYRASPVLEAMYGDDARIPVLRFSLGRPTGPREVEGALELTARVVERLRRLADPAPPRSATEAPWA